MNLSEGLQLRTYVIDHHLNLTSLARIVILQLIYLLYLYTRKNKPAFCSTYLMCCLFFTTRNIIVYGYDITSGNGDSKETDLKKITTPVWNINSDEAEKNTILKFR